MDIQEQFKLEFANAFPKLRLATERAKDQYVALEVISDGLAGPLYSILVRGNCDYVFEDTKGRFPGVSTVEDFRLWAAQHAEKYRKGVEGFEALDAAEAADRAILLEKAIAMRRVAELGYQIQKEHDRQ